jgi:hypothetical protein
MAFLFYTLTFIFLITATGTSLSPLLFLHPKG